MVVDYLGSSGIGYVVMKESLESLAEVTLSILTVPSCVGGFLLAKLERRFRRIGAMIKRRGLKHPYTSLVEIGAWQLMG